MPLIESPKIDQLSPIHSIRLIIFSENFRLDFGKNLSSQIKQLTFENVMIINNWKSAKIVYKEGSCNNAELLSFPITHKLSCISSRLLLQANNNMYSQGSLLSIEAINHHQKGHLERQQTVEENGGPQVVDVFQGNALEKVGFFSQFNWLYFKKSEEIPETFLPSLIEPSPDLFPFN